MRNIVFRELEANETYDPTMSLIHAWDRIRVPIIAPILRVTLYICIGMSVMLFVERVYMAFVIACVKCLGKKRYTKYQLDNIKEDLEKNKNYPKVLVQIPMFNEKEKRIQSFSGAIPTTLLSGYKGINTTEHNGNNMFYEFLDVNTSNKRLEILNYRGKPYPIDLSQVYKLSIGAVSGLSWPSDRLVVQVLDDSTNEVLRTMVELECRKWVEKGVNVKYETRNNRNGYKAGALRDGLKKPYVEDCEFVIIFDADFQPEEDFLWRTIPYLLENPELGLVQARWKFVNADECLMTRLQEMSLDYHFSVEQEVGSSTCSFFGFNGTAGVWRMTALNDAGGWKDRTTVEDMDLAVRASLKGWKFLFVGDLAVKNELPSTFKAYRYQQHRWSCGPANLFRKMLKEIILCERVSIWKKWHVIYAFFFVRKIIAHWVTFFLYCVVMPATILVPEVHLPRPLAIYLPAGITILNAASTIRSIHLLVFWILFENVMSLHRSKAAIIGLLEANRVNEWVVTEKLGNTMKQKNNARAPKKPRSRIRERIQVLEIIVGMYLLHCAIYNILFGHNHFFIYLLLQAGAFFIVGIGYVGTFVPN